MKRPLILVCFLLLIATNTPSSRSHTEFMKALKSEYNFRSVTCSACHPSKSKVPADELALYEKNAKSVRNAFGKIFAKHLKGKDITKRLAEVKELKANNPKKEKVSVEVTKEFLEALKKVKAEKSPSGKTYGELLEKGPLEGVRRR